MASMFDKDDWLRRLDDKVGDGVESALKAHHRRRLHRIGWDDALAPDDGDEWWSSHAEIRSGNLVEVLIDGSSAFPEMQAAIQRAEEFVHIAGWHASPDFSLTRGPDALSLRDLLAQTAERVPVRLLLWAGPPLPAFQPTRKTVKQASAGFTRDSRVKCALDNREYTLHCHHEKIIVIDGRLAFVGGMDFTALQGDRYDEPAHAPRDPMGWHDVAVRLRGPAVADVARHFNARWSEVTSEPLPDVEEPAAAGDTDVQVLRTVPERTYDFAPRGDFTILEAYLRAIRSSERFIYIENQFLWSPEVIDALADKLKNPPHPDFRILALLPTNPSDGAETTRGQLGRLLAADGKNKRLLATTVSGQGGDKTAPVYVHAKVSVIDDRWLTIGSANLNEHSLFNDTEMNIVTCDAELARSTRLRLWSEHTGASADELDRDPHTVIDEVWRPTAEEQARRSREGLPRTHRLTMLSKVSKRTDRLEGPMRGLMVDG